MNSNFSELSAESIAYLIANSLSQNECSFSIHSNGPIRVSSSRENLNLRDPLVAYYNLIADADFTNISAAEVARLLSVSAETLTYLLCSFDRLPKDSVYSRPSIRRTFEKFVMKREPFNAFPLEVSQ